jgi:hypothetical protein
MWLSWNTLAQLVDLKGLSPEEVAARLTMATAEIEGIEYLNRHFATIVAANCCLFRPTRL